MKQIAIVVTFWMMSVASFSIRPAPVAAEEDDFTFGDVFLQKESEQKVEFHGYVASQYYDSQGGKPGSFDQHIFEPFFGYQVNDHVFAKLILELEHVPEKQDDGQFAEIFPEQAEIDITFREGTTLAFGAILVPFGLENYLHAPSDNRLITRPPINKGGKAIVSNTWTDMGIQLTQDIQGVGVFDFYVINGSAKQTKGERGREDKIACCGNHGKSFGAEIQVTKLYPGLNVGASFVQGPHDATNQLDSTRLGVHASMDWKRVYVIGEYMMGTDEGLGAVTRDRDASGYYIVISITPAIDILENRVDVNTRLTDWTFDDDAGDDHSEIAFGVRYRFMDMTWAKVEYQINNEDGSNIEVDNDRFALQLSVLF